MDAGDIPGVTRPVRLFEWQKHVAIAITQLTQEVHALTAGGLVCEFDLRVIRSVLQASSWPEGNPPNLNDAP